MYRKAHIMSARIAQFFMNPRDMGSFRSSWWFLRPSYGLYECHERFRADKLIEDWAADVNFEKLEVQLTAGLRENDEEFVDVSMKINCPTWEKA